MLLEGKKALITGSRRGIGRAMAYALAAEGADIGINDVEFDDNAAETIRTIEGMGRMASWHLANVGKGAEINRMIDEFLEKHGRIDIMINNAAKSKKQHFLAITEEDWDTELDVQLKGYFIASQRAAREMVKSGKGGRIICIGSVMGLRAWPHSLVYGVCKSALTHMVQSMAVDMSGYNISVNCIAPGYIDSRVLPPELEHMRGGPGYADYSVQRLPSRRGGVPEDIAGAAVFLTSRLGEYVNGQTIVVDGGFLPLPGTWGTWDW